ncbi:hypothetical protein Pla110_46320 [Polystyrenella longa]|uniref:Uncharacterized protein n=1 Tax=Polystyrenella longa TaxID=2528007 RepID=A0A518CUF9_9PLAN|nr:hypothetical protein [Polystyrenella longa]QDU82869.1 hypothetical protein Pla110_46320 [Polystyrenella longa]
MSSLSMFLHFIPVSLVITLVYNCSRYENKAIILRNTGRSFLYLVGFMSLMFGILWGCSYSL